ncbi:MAG: hypothetical protein NT124_00710 [Candidatus Dependentiae bacterium]|nr:hypothetical protein [Candidatus Dependentiae bacterium]
MKKLLLLLSSMLLCSIPTMYAAAEAHVPGAAVPARLPLSKIMSDMKENLNTVSQSQVGEFTRQLRMQAGPAQTIDIESAREILNKITISALAPAAVQEQAKIEAAPIAQPGVRVVNEVQLPMGHEDREVAAAGAAGDVAAGAVAEDEQPFRDARPAPAVVVDERDMGQNDPDREGHNPGLAALNPHAQEEKGNSPFFYKEIPRFFMMTQMHPKPSLIACNTAMRFSY